MFLQKDIEMEKSNVRVLHHRRLRQGSIMTSPQSFQSVYGYYVCVREAYQFITEKNCCLEKIHLLFGLLDRLSLYARREFNFLSWEEREKINYLTEEEKFLFRIFITADLEKLNKKTNKQYEGYGSAVKTGYSFLKKKILYWFA